MMRCSWNNHVISCDRWCSRFLFSSCIPGAFSWITLSTAQVGTPWRVGSKGVTLVNILLSRIPLISTLGAFLISFEGVIIFHHLLKTLMRHQEDMDRYTRVFHRILCDLFSHAHSLHILPFSKTSTPIKTQTESGISKDIYATRASFHYSFNRNLKMK